MSSISSMPPKDPLIKSHDHSKDGIFLTVGIALSIASIVACLATYFFGNLGNMPYSSISLPNSLLFLTGLIPGLYCLKAGLPEPKERTSSTELASTLTVMVASIVLFLWATLENHLGTFSVGSVLVPYSTFILMGCVPGFYHMMKSIQEEPKPPVRKPQPSNPTIFHQSSDNSSKVNPKSNINHPPLIQPLPRMTASNDQLQPITSLDDDLAQTQGISVGERLTMGDPKGKAPIIVGDDNSSEATMGLV